MDKPAGKPIEHHAAKQCAQPHGNQIDDRRAAAKDFPDRRHRGRVRRGPDDQERPGPRPAKRPDGSAPRRSAPKPWRKHKAECPPPSGRESKAARRPDALQTIGAGSSAAIAPAIATPAKSGQARSRGRVTNPYLAARSQAGAGGSPEQHESVHAGGTSASAEFALPNTSTSSSAQNAADQGGDGPKNGKDRPQQGVGHGNAVDPGLRRGKQERGRRRPARAVPPHGSHHGDHAARTKRQRNPQQGRLHDRPDALAAQVPLGPLGRDPDRHQARPAQIRTASRGPSPG